MGDGVEVEIARLGAQGDGVADLPGGARFIPFALPGERWRLKDGGTATLLSESAERRPAPCPHFGRCGGCIAQHMSADLYASWKTGIVAEAFRHRGIEAEVLPLIRVAPHSRRRAFLGVERHGSEVIVGFREEGRHKLVDLAECLVLDPDIVRALPALRAVARYAMAEGQGGRLVVTRLDHGLDVAFDNGIKDLPPDARMELALLAERARLIRLTVAGEVIAETGPCTVTLGGVAVDAPQSVFMQAVPEAEEHLIELVLAAMPRRAKKVGDLFAGLGTFAFPLARAFRVVAIDSDKRAIAALAGALKHAQGLKPVEVKVRDLFREPLAPKELDAFDAVVLDPPRAGAAEQAARIARSKVPVVVAVSCNAATLARDARLLIDGGYTMGQVAVIDQFIYTPHVEAVAVFRRR